MKLELEPWKAKERNMMAFFPAGFWKRNPNYYAVARLFEGDPK